MQASKVWIETCVERVEAKKAAFEAVFRFISAMPSSLCLPILHELGLEQSGQPLLLETMLGGGYTKCCRAHSAVPVFSYNMSAVLTCRRKKWPASATRTDGGGEAGWKNSLLSLLLASKLLLHWRYSFLVSAGQSAKLQARTTTISPSGRHHRHYGGRRPAYVR